MSLRANGLTGQAANHALLSVVFFAGFFVAMHIMLGTLLTLPLMMRYEAMLMAPATYFRVHGVWTSTLIAALFVVLHALQPVLVRFQTKSHPIEARHRARVERAVAHHCGVLGLPLPELVQIPSPARNAFTHGLSRNRATIGVTTGLLEGLDDDALAAVLAHECVHIARGDTALMAVAYTALDTIHLLRVLNPLGALRRHKWVFIFMWPLVLVFILCAFAQHVAMTVANATRLLIASSRDFVADAEAVRLTHNPRALVRALHAVYGHDAVHGLSPTLGASLFAGPDDGQDAHHAPIADRIEALTRLSGAMMHGASPVRDTRAAALARSGGSAYGGGMAPRAAFGQRRPAPAHTPLPRRRANIVDRVNARTDSKADYSRGTSSAYPKMMIAMLLLIVGLPYASGAATLPWNTGKPAIVGDPTPRITVEAVTVSLDPQSKTSPTVPTPSLKPEPTRATAPALRR